MVGTAGFEPATTCTPSKCATRLRYVPTGRAKPSLALRGERCRKREKRREPRAPAFTHASIFAAAAPWDNRRQEDRHELRPTHSRGLPLAYALPDRPRRQPRHRVLSSNLGGARTPAL